MLKKVMQSEALDPRTRNSRIPQDLSVICQKAMEKESSRRYATMAEFAADLRRWLNGEAIHARPAGPMLRARKWVLRHRAVSMAVSGALIVLLSFAAVYGYRQIQSEGRYRELMREGAEAAGQEQWDVAIDRLVRALSKDPMLALLLALEGAERNETLTTRNALLQSLLQSRERTTIVVRHSPFLPEVEKLQREHHRHVHFDPSGKRLLNFSCDPWPRIRDPISGEQLLSLEQLPEVRRSRSKSSLGLSGLFDPAGETVAITAAGYGFGLMDAHTGEFIWGFETRGPLYGRDFSPDGRWIALGSGEGRLDLRESKTGQVVWSTKAHLTAIHTISFSSDGQYLATCCEDSTVKVWETRTGNLHVELCGHGEDIRSAQFGGPDGRRIFTACGDRTLHIWDAHTGESLKNIRVPGDALISVHSIAFNRDRTRMSASWGDPVVRVWDTETGEETLQLHGRQGIVRWIDFSPDGTRIATAAFDNTARLWDAQTGEELAVLRGHRDFLHHVEFSPNSRWVATISEDNTIRVWDAAVHQRPADYQGITPLDMRLDNASCLSRDGTLRFTSNGTATGYLHGATDVAEEGIALPHENDVLGGQFSSDGKLLVTGSSDGLQDGPDGYAYVWDAVTGKLLGKFELGKRSPESAGFNQSGELLVVGLADGTVHIRNWASGKVTFQCSGHDRWVHTLTFNNDGNRLVTASSDGTARVWDVDTGAELMVLSGHEGAVLLAGFDPAGGRILTVGDDFTMRLWDSQSGEELLTLPGIDPDVLLEFGFDSAGTEVALLFKDNTVLRFPSNVITAARERKSRELTIAEREAHALLGPGGEEALALVRRLFDEYILRGDVEVAIREDPALSAQVREVALHLASRQDDYGKLLYSAAWKMKGKHPDNPVIQARGDRFLAAGARLEKQAAEENKP